eukprot:SM000149S01331  [mRNA]  locus=s149:130717:136614:+ [translate_table: standard]
MAEAAAAADVKMEEPAKAADLAAIAAAAVSDAVAAVVGGFAADGGANGNQHGEAGLGGGAFRAEDEGAAKAEFIAELPHGGVTSSEPLRDAQDGSGPAAAAPGGGGGSAPEPKAGAAAAKEGAARRKPGRPRKVPARKPGEEDVCFICKDGGDLVVCDQLHCPKSYHFECINQDKEAFKSGSKWICDYHFCRTCKKKPFFQCFTCCTAYCRKCIEDVEFKRLQRGKGLCNECLTLAGMLERHETIGVDGMPIDFTSPDTYENYYKEYWEDLRKNLSQAVLDQIKEHVKGPRKGFAVGEMGAENSDTDIEGHSEEEPPEAPPPKRKPKAKVAPTRGPSKQRGNGRRRLAKVVESESDEDTDDKEQEVFEDDDEDVVKEVAAPVVSPRKKRLTKAPSLAAGRASWASPQLIEFLSFRGGDVTKMINRYGATKLIWQHIKENNLQDPRDKRNIICDAHLRPLFGDKVGMFTMAKMLGMHYQSSQNKANGISIEVESPVDTSKVSMPIDVHAGEGVEEEASRLDKGEQEMQVNVAVMADRPSRKGQTRAEETRRPEDAEPHPTDWAAINMKNISLIFLKRSLLEDLLINPQFDSKVVKGFVRLRVPGVTASDNIYRLMQIVGVHLEPDLYSTGRKMTNKTLMVQSATKVEPYRINLVSNQDFDEEEVKYLRESMRLGILPRLTVGEVEDKVADLRVAKVNEWFETEQKRLTNLRDRASEKGLQKELRDCVIKLRELESLEFKAAKLKVMSKVEADPSLDADASPEFNKSPRVAASPRANQSPRFGSPVWTRDDRRAGAPSREATSHQPSLKRGREDGGAPDPGQRDSGKHSPEPNRRDARDPGEAWRQREREADDSEIVERLRNRKREKERRRERRREEERRRERDRDRDRREEPRYDRGKERPLPRSVSPALARREEAGAPDSRHSFSGADTVKSATAEAWQAVPATLPPLSGATAAAGPAVQQQPGLQMRAPPELAPQPGAAVPAQGLHEAQEDDKVWHYVDPQGDTQGPFSITQLRSWLQHFPPDLRAWRGDHPRARESSILITDIIQSRDKPDSQPQAAAPPLQPPQPTAQPAAPARVILPPVSMQQPRSSFDEQAAVPMVQPPSHVVPSNGHSYRTHGAGMTPGLGVGPPRQGGEPSSRHLPQLGFGASSSYEQPALRFENADLAGSSQFPLQGGRLWQDMAAPAGPPPLPPPQSGRGGNLRGGYKPGYRNAAGQPSSAGDREFRSPPASERAREDAEQDRGHPQKWDQPPWHMDNERPHSPLPQEHFRPPLNDDARSDGHRRQGPPPHQGGGRSPRGRGRGPEPRERIHDSSSDPQHRPRFSMPCKFWRDRGFCNRGSSCHFVHS